MDQSREFSEGHVCYASEEVENRTHPRLSSWLSRITSTSSLTQSAMKQVVGIVDTTIEGSTGG